jgi:hypothetical protein
MRKLCFVLFVLLLPLPAFPQHSPSLPAIGLPLPAIGLAPAPWEQRRLPPWERPQIPEWERNRIPPWEKGYVPKRTGHDVHQRHVVGGPQFVYYYVPYAVPIQQSPQVIVVQQPPVTNIITVEVPARSEEARAEPPAEMRNPEPPFVPSGDRTVYVIPGCYVGNVPPANVKLPPNCDVKRVTTFNP